MLEKLLHAAVFPVLRGTVGKDRILKAAYIHVAELPVDVLGTVEEYGAGRLIRLLRRRIRLAAVVVCAVADVHGWSVLGLHVARSVTVLDRSEEREREREG